MKGLPGWTVFLLALLLPTAMPAANDPNARALDDLAERYWQYQVSTDYNLRTQLGLPIETIRPVGLEAAEQDASAAQGILDGLAGIDAGRLDHDRWLTYRTLSFLAT